MPLDTSTSMGTIVSPKKKLLYRSQSQTESATNPAEEILLDDQQQFHHLNDIPLTDLNPIPPPAKSQKRTSFTIQSEITSTNTKRQKQPANEEFASNDDQRKKQIRDSNREAARRCRERRRNYIEQLEGNLEQFKAQIKQLQDKLGRAERENTQLRTILTETKILHLSRESTNDFSHIITTN